MYTSRWDQGNKVCYVPKDDHYRPRFDVLAKTGVVRTVKTNHEALQAFPINILREVAVSLNCKNAQSKKQLCENLSAYSEKELAIIWDKTTMNKNDLFILLPIV